MKHRSPEFRHAAEKGKRRKHGIKAKKKADQKRYRDNTRQREGQ